MIIIMHIEIKIIIIVMLLIYIKSFIINNRNNVITSVTSSSTSSCSYIRRSITVINAKDDKKKTYTKSNLPSKICIVCNRPFEYRKKWEKVWDEVKYCSDRCRGQRNSINKNTDQKLPLSRKSTSSMPRSMSSMPRSMSSLSSMISKSAIILSLSLPICFNVNADNHPTKNDIDTVFTAIVNDASLIDEDDLLRKENYRRLDESNDKEYYKSPRFTEHIDKDAVNSLIKLHDKLIKDTATSLYNDNNHMLSILDICASHVSHLPSTYNKEQAIKNNAVIVGIGMNEEELVANPALTSSYVIDLNESPTMLGIPDNTFDLVLLQLSIDYLIHPIDVLKEAGRVLKTNGRIVISFSNRLFFDKAISAWSGKADIDHIELVGRYLLATKKFGTPIAIDATVSKSNVDPLYAVTAIKL